MPKVIRRILTMFAVSVISLLLLNTTSFAYADDVNYSVKVEDSLNISVSSDDVILNINPLVEQFVSKDLTVTVSTNNIYGYRMYIKTDDTRLTKTDDVDTYIENIDIETNQNSFPINQWGSKINSNILTQANYNPFISGTLISRSKTATNGDVSTVTFASKADMDMPAGSYKLDLEFETVAIIIPDITSIDYMQEMTPEIAAATAEGTVATLKDSRDEQEYTLTKLFDGNIWMTKNLNIAGGTKLTSERSNVTTEYILPNSSTSGWDSDSGQYVYNSGSTVCGNNSPCYSYYSFIVANAGTTPTGPGNPNQDICPANWRLPTIDELQVLVTEWSTASQMVNGPFAGVYNGLYYNNAFQDGGTWGQYWSSTGRVGHGTSGHMYFSTTKPSATHYENHRDGMGIRCIAKTK